jgi:flagellar biosynthetic protein FliR
MEMWGYDIWSLMLGFARIGALVMLMPGIGEAAVSPRMRLGFALLLSLLVAPSAPEPAELGQAIGLVIGEVLTGLMFGAGARMMMAALSSAGQIVGLETGLSFAQSYDPTAGQSGATISAFLGLMGVAFVMATNLHHLFILGVADSYNLISPGKPPTVADASEFALRAFSQSFRIALQIAAPVIVAGTVFRLGLGVLARLTPQIQVFFVAMPLQIMMGFLVLALGLSTGMIVWLDQMGDYARLGAR